MGGGEAHIIKRCKKFLFIFNLIIGSDSVSDTHSVHKNVIKDCIWTVSVPSSFPAVFLMNSPASSSIECCSSLALSDENEDCLGTDLLLVCFILELLLLPEKRYELQCHQIMFNMASFFNQSMHNANHIMKFYKYITVSSMSL